MTAAAIRYLVLWVTTACNLRCACCYRGDPSPMTMDTATAEAALRLAASSGRPFHVQLSGGEPTLEPRRVAAIAKSVRDAGWQATMAIQTNGTLLDNGVLEICRRYAVSVGVSLDGPPQIQERLRGGASETFHGLELLARFDLPVRVTTVLSAGNTPHLGELLLALAAFPTVEGVGFDPLVLKGRALRQKAEIPSEESIRHGVTAMLEVLGRVNRARRVPLRCRELEAVRKALSDGASSRPYCHACSGESLAVHPDGTVYPCSQTIGDPAMRAGTVASVDWQRLKSVFRGAALKGHCGECPLAGRCPGDCPSRLTYNDGPSRQVMCTVYQTICAYLTREDVP
ncbi:MAG: radical SAM protein [Deltaproteobacteria bacterium]|nr:radical SAM protein [Deltaproteobacteria bacterium]